jgi:hypothetical protein
LTSPVSSKEVSSLSIDPHLQKRKKKMLIHLPIDWFDSSPETLFLVLHVGQERRRNRRTNSAKSATVH